MSSYILHVPPGYASELVSHEGEELIYILEGEIAQSRGGQVFHMRPGDSLHDDGMTPHAWANRTDLTAVRWTAATMHLVTR